ncbi:adenylate/guanylate cyclase domain-containing protein [Sinorhizobium meliloti]|uniref:adenylate cyclase CyaK n=1 Tax=Rhizobium meliloti TaxID=382 RepID=UPI000FD4BFE5|nr:adenylate cyclase CyaK [Sinorhizobium meliloti]RVG54995.1 adenylate/guanylate cyclase domain-containing protein [Sinorhizobium meliloti]RVL56457.1 adenylate/guanylate cyclase domain-containing protein [Sinorhizobium meliloti]RVL74917.1 adenylate/guanylate cyclase domain-containing protein [Sinorhizobium meliloti]RVP65185.1 adenylate/guanylate cyclase domain-containing protein [Sinorhizobium meliloti]RVP93152.1 adenylate/guanylate cyclase domain-containing protein [Sinorhizobium meliloti]
MNDFRELRLSSRRVKLAALTAFVAALVSAVSLTGTWSLVDLRAYDYLSIVGRPTLPEDGPVIVAIDEPSMAEIGSQWPWPRALHARLIQALRVAGARAIALDVIFAEPAAAPENDQALAEVLGSDVVLAGDEMLIRTPQAEQFVRTEPLPVFLERGAKVGIASVDLSGDGTLRQIPSYPDGLAVTLATVAGAKPAHPPRRALMQTFGPARTYPTVSYYQALDPESFLPEETFRGRVVIVGLSLQNAPTISGGGIDAFATSDTVFSRGLVAGAEIHATIYDNLVHRLFVKRAGAAVAVTAIVLASLAAALAVLGSTSWKTLGYGALALILIFLASYGLMRLAHVFVSPLAPALAFLGVAVGQAGLDYAEERRRRRAITRAFSQYLSPALVERLARDPSQLKLGGERRTLTVLFCDVRGFTTISEDMKDDPEGLTTLINRLLTPLSEAVLNRRGTIDKYIGDCLMAFWNAPLDDPDHAVHAVQAARDMLTALGDLNAELEAEAKAAGRPPKTLRIGIGINTGECVVGNMGSARRFDYSALGDAVNLASRLEGASKDYGVPLLLGERTATLAARKFAVAELDRITVKGRSAVSPVFTLADGASEPALERHRAYLARKYSGEIAADDGLFDELKAALPPLARYYERERERLLK